MNRTRLFLVFVLLFSCAACAVHRTAGSFRVLPASPQYLLRTPDGAQIFFGESLERYNGFKPGHDGMDLHPDMELRIENAYYKPGFSKQGLNGFLGTEIAHYLVESRGLRLLSVQPMQNRPNDQLPVQRLITASQTHYRDYRFYFEVLFRDESRTRGSVLLGADSEAELQSLANRLIAQPASVCSAQSVHCTVFPQACSVSVEMRVFVNGSPRSVLWNSELEGVVQRPQAIELLRRYRGRYAQVKLNPRDPEALRMPLLPGDIIRWK